MARKVFVEVTAKFDTEGRIIPLSLLWEDGTVYEINRVLDVRRAASRNPVYRKHRRQTKLSVF